MPTRVFGPHVTGLNHFGLHIGATTEVWLGDGGNVPNDLTLKLTGLLGESSSTPVQEDAQTSVTALPGLTVTGIINNCTTVPAQGQTPAQFTFKVTLRANGIVKIALIPLPVNIQIDAFDVAIAVDPRQHVLLTLGAPAFSTTP